MLSHAEMNRNGQAMITAIRYHDRYRRHEGAWRFSERVLTFFYYVPATQYVDALGDGLAGRMRAYGDKEARRLARVAAHLAAVLRGLSRSPTSPG